MNVILVFGPPAVGKFTIGSNLADKLGFAFIHEHMLLDIIPQFGIKERKNRVIVYFSFWFYLLEQTFRHCEKPGLLLTMVVDFSDKLFSRFLAQAAALVLRNNGTLFLIELTAPLEARLNRNGNPDRLYYKPSKREIEKSSVQIATLDKYCVFNTEDTIVHEGIVHSKFSTERGSADDVVTSILEKLLPFESHSH